MYNVVNVGSAPVVAPLPGDIGSHFGLATVAVAGGCLLAAAALLFVGLRSPIAVFEEGADVMDDAEEAHYVFRPPLNDSTSLVFIPGMGGRGGFSQDWRLDRPARGVSQAVWSHPGMSESLDKRAQGLARSFEGRHRLVLMGHSMGCHIALEAAARATGDEVAGLILACQAPPHLTPVFDTSTMNNRDLATLLEIPSSVAESDEALAAFGALWRQEYARLNAYLRSAPSTRVHVPVVAVGATEDNASCDAAVLEAWGAYTDAAIWVDMMDGGHNVVEQLTSRQLNDWCRLISEARSVSEWS